MNSAVHCTDASVDLKSKCKFTTCFGLSSPLSGRPMVAFEIEDRKCSRKLFWSSILDITIIIWTARLNASFQQQFSDIYCLQIILKSI
jgi:hypothetical protein